VKPFATLRGATLRHDLIAALTLAALALPEQLATARLAGLPAAQGIAVFAAASVVMVLVSRDRVLSVGADSSIAPVIAAALAAAAVPGSAALIAAMVGLILCVLALFRLDGIARLLSLPVAAGMMAGIAIHILVGRLPTALGVEVRPESPLKTLAGVWDAAASIRLEPLAMTVLVAALCLAGRGWHPRFPAALVAMTLAVAVAVWIDPAQTMLPRAATDVGDWGLVPPVPDLDAALGLLPAALVIAFLCLFQTTVVLREAGSDRSSDRRNAIGAVGLANLAVSAVGGFAVNTSPPRTAILRDAGASSQLAGLGAAGISLAVLMLMPGLVQHLPAAALAGVLIFVALHILPLGTMTQLLRRSPSEAAIALATMALVTLLPLQSGLPLAILLSLLHATLPLLCNAGRQADTSAGHDNLVAPPRCRRYPICERHSGARPYSANEFRHGRGHRRRHSRFHGERPGAATASGAGMRGSAVDRPYRGAGLVGTDRRVPPRGNGRGAGAGGVRPRQPSTGPQRLARHARPRSRFPERGRSGPRTCAGDRAVKSKTPKR
jgi:SulP family sulfate permease